MTVLSESFHGPAPFLMGERGQSGSRSAVVILAGQTLLAGAVIGRVNKTVDAVPLVVGTGNGTISAITLGPDARPGTYRLEITRAIANGGQFKLTDPDGELVDTGFIVAGAGGTYVGANKRQINFTVTEGAIDFAVGDAFDVVVTPAVSGGKVVAWDPTVVDGRDDVAGVLYDHVDAAAEDLPGVIIARDATVIKGLLTWAAAITAAQKESAYLDLEARGIICR